jgi:hypothetical protein
MPISMTDPLVGRPHFPAENGRHGRFNRLRDPSLRALWGSGARHHDLRHGAGNSFTQPISMAYHPAVTWAMAAIQLPVVSGLLTAHRLEWAQAVNPTQLGYQQRRLTRRINPVIRRVRWDGLGGADAGGARSSVMAYHLGPAAPKGFASACRLCYPEDNGLDTGAEHACRQAESSGQLARHEQARADMEELLVSRWGRSVNSLVRGGGRR